MSDIIKQVDDKFKSSNSVPVERVPLTLNEWNEIKYEIEELRQSEASLMSGDDYERGAE